MNSTISRKEQKPQIFISMTIILVLVIVLSFILKTSSLHSIQTSIPLRWHQVQVISDTEFPVAVPVPEPLAMLRRPSAMPAASGTLKPVVVPQPVPVPVPSVP